MDTAALDRTSSLIIQSAIEIHKVLGPGLLESAYRTRMIHELGLRNLKVRSELIVPVRYKTLLLDGDYRFDLPVDDAVIVELKAVETVLPVHRAQVLSYLRLTGNLRRYIHRHSVVQRTCSAPLRLCVETVLRQ